MKRILGVLCIVLLVLSLAACDGKGQGPASEPSVSQGGGKVISGGGSPSPASGPAPEPSAAGPEKSDPEEPSAPESASSDTEPEESAPQQSDGDAAFETIPQEEQQSYFRKYIQLYYIAGLMYSTWSDPNIFLGGEPLEPWQYLRFYICNESENYWSEHPVNDTFSIPTDIVEEYLSRCFNIDWRSLHTAENYDPDTGSYLSMHTEGIGGGPGVSIERVEKDGDIWKFVCRDEGGNLLSVSIRVVDENTFRYVAGEGLDL